MNKQTKVNKYGCHEIVRVRQKICARENELKALIKIN
jgi:hypothetical protein